MDLKTFKLLFYFALCLSVVNSQFTTTDLPTEPDSPGRTDNPVGPQNPPTDPENPVEPEDNQGIDAATISQFNLDAYGAANRDYGPFAYHTKYIPAVSDHSFSYNEEHPRGPSRWAERWPQCGGPNQSPINIPVDQCRSQTSNARLQYYNANQRPRNVTIENNGYSIEYLFHFESTPILFGGPLQEGYVFEFIHFHWGLADGDGTEHQLSSVKYELEMHAGHRNAKYADMTEAAQYDDGIVVLAILFQVSDTVADNPRFGEINRVQSVNTSIEMQNPNGYRLRDFVGALNEETVNVQGSLTTPPCSPANWVVATTLREISRNDLNTFRSMRRNGEPIAPNYRPLQSRPNLQCSRYSN